MTMIRLVLATLALATFAGCKTVKIKDGQVPSQYLSQAKQLSGTYKGTFDGTPGNLNISFVGSKPVITYANKRGDDILNNNCRSEFGDLLTVTVKKENTNPTVSSAVFAFDAGGCSLFVEGRKADLSFKQTDKGTRVTVTILKELRQQHVCDWKDDRHPNRPVPPHQYCRTENTPIYLKGTFYR